MRIQDINAEIKNRTRCRLSETQIHKLCVEGNFAPRYILGKYDISIPFKYELRKRCGRVVEADDKRLLPLQHPAATLYNVSIKEVLVRNYQKMRLFFRSGPLPQNSEVGV